MPTSDDLVRRWREAKLGERVGGRVLVSIECEGDPRAEVLGAVDVIEDEHASGCALLTDPMRGECDCREDLIDIDKPIDLDRLSAAADMFAPAARSVILALIELLRRERSDTWRETVGVSGPPEAFGLPGGEAVWSPRDADAVVTDVDRETGTVTIADRPARRDRKRGGKA